MQRAKTWVDLALAAVRTWMRTHRKTKPARKLQPQRHWPAPGPVRRKSPQPQAQQMPLPRRSRIRNTQKSRLHHMTDELKHPADGPEQEISSDPAGFAADAAEETKQAIADRSEEHTSELQSLRHLVC